ncbi:MAG: MBL fold metallo-hydrolase [Rhodocyclaceae bacterium]|nr:MBL fold metallo-hydrolase [Rhodocyclaceae bacterium]
MQAQIQSFFDPATHTITHVVFDREGGSAAVIDPVWDFNPHSGRTATHSVDQVADFLRGQRLRLEWILETHAHADHLSAAQHLRREFGGRIGIGARIQQVQDAFRRIYNLGDDFAADGRQFDHLFEDGERFRIGDLEAEAILVAGHTPADLMYLIGDAAFIGDTMFMPDTGTARCDFPGGDARALYRSIRRILALPEQTRLYLCHDYAPDERAPQWQTSVAEQRRANIHVHDGIDEDSFVAMREKRDATLDMPVLLIPSIQVNIRAGQLPPAEGNGRHYLKFPVDAL